MNRSMRPPPPADESGSALLGFGTAVGLATLASLVCVLPAAMRVSPAVAAVEGAPRVWIALSAAALGPMVACVLVLRGAREGLRSFAGRGRELRAFGVGVWLSSLLVTFSLFGGLLRATTHHHALAGVTFAFGAVLLAVGQGLVCIRLVAILRGASRAPRRLLGLTTAVLMVMALAWIGLRFARAAARDPSSAAAAAVVIDVLACGLAAGFAARPSFTSQRAFALVGPPIAVTVVLLGGSALRDPPLRAAIAERAPAFSPVVECVPAAD